MLKIQDYSEQIEALHQQGFSALDWERLHINSYKQPTLYDVDKKFFQSIDTEEKAYVFGFICADGHISETRNAIVIAVKQDDVDILYKIRTAMQSTHPIKEHIQKRNPYTNANHLVLEQACISINGKELIQPLLKIGLNHRKTYTLNGSEINSIPENLVHHFLRGYFDGDGNVVWGRQYNTGKKYNINVTGNRDFLENTFQKCFPSTNALYKDKYSKQCYTWKISERKKVLDFLSYIYGDATIYLDRKYKVYQYALWSFKTGLIAGNSYFINLIKGQSAANPLVKCWRQVQRLMDETITNPYGEEYNSNTNAQQFDFIQIEDIV